MMHLTFEIRIYTSLTYHEINVENDLICILCDTTEGFLKPWTMNTRASNPIYEDKLDIHNSVPWHIRKFRLYIFIATHIVQVV